MAHFEISITIPLGAGRLFAPDRSDVSSAFGQVFAKRGYIVIATRPGPRFPIGERLRNLWGYQTRRVFVVSEITTKADLEAQHDMLCELRKGVWTRRAVKYPAGTTFYRVVPLAIARKQKLLPAKGKGKLHVR